MFEWWLGNFTVFEWPGSPDSYDLMMNTIYIILFAVIMIYILCDIWDKR